MRVCIYGASSDRIASIYKETSMDLGERLGKAGIGIVFGAGETGVMGAVARGFRKGSPDGELIGIAPRFFDQPGVLFQDCSQMLWPENMRERKQLMEEYSDVFVVMPGGIGTMDEFFEILTLRQLKRHEKKIILYNVEGYYDWMKQLLKRGVEDGFMVSEDLELCTFADDADTLLALL